jgi:hypothetical protein
VIPALRRLRQEKLKFKTSPYHTAKPYLEKGETQREKHKIHIILWVRCPTQHG